MPKKRNKENQGLPAGWRKLHGAYYYKVPVSTRAQWDGKQLFRLGKTSAEAYQTFADKMKVLDKANNISKLLDRYILEVLPIKAAKTRTEQLRQSEKIRAVFGAMALGTIEPKDIYEYVDKHPSKVSAKREIALLSHALTKATKWGYIRNHPFKGEVRFDGEYSEKPRDRYVEDWEIAELQAIGPVRNGNDATMLMQAIAALILITGLAKGDILRIRPAADFKDDGIHVMRHKTAVKTGKRTVYEWTEGLRLAVEVLMKLRPVDISPFLICTKRGEGYFNEAKGTCTGFDSMWQRFMARLVDETKIEEKFTLHDLRAKAGSDADSDEHARALLSHANVSMTRRVYRRKPERAKPLK